ncbi:multiheme c-type cytochrome [Pseudomonas syringae group genomosp. 7]|uniref:multiheme c-type cytochrome n=1 Tax=Pseudomonas syringae group genomosp. 7 TaxID=251699 RepID=UPI0035C835CD
MKKRQQEYCRWCHAIGQQPEEQMLVAEKTIAGKGIGCRQCHAQRYHGVEAHVVQRVEVAAVPALVGEDHLVVGQGKILRPQGQAAEDLGIGLERHVDQPVDRHQQKQQVNPQRYDFAQTHDPALNSFRRGSWRYRTPMTPTE